MLERQENIVVTVIAVGYRTVTVRQQARDLTPPLPQLWIMSEPLTANRFSSVRTALHDQIQRGSALRRTRYKVHHATDRMVSRRIAD